VPDLLLAGRWVLAMVLVVAGVRKLLAPSRDPVAEAMRNYGTIPDALVPSAAFVLPWLEVGLGLLLCVGVMLLVAAACAAAALGVFAIAVGWHLVRGHRFDCGCGGAGEISWQLAGRDLSLCAVAVAVVFGPSGGLAAWPGWGASAVAGSAEAMVPVPLVTILLMVTVQLLLRVRRDGLLGSGRLVG
jgi:putative oxidoreductase